MSGTPASERLVSLDAFRGFTIAAMVLVNNPGDWGNLYSQLAHAEWNGWTFTDWIFPFFLFICGVSMSFSLGRRAMAGEDRGALVAQTLKRAAIIFLIGFLLNLIPAFNFAAVRIPGVLQRIALCVALAAPLAVYAGWRARAAWIALLLAIYSVLMLLTPFPGGEAGMLEPGRDIGAWLDRTLMDGHLWAKSRTWDPEGLVSTLPALCTLLFGTLAGEWLRAGRAPADTTVWLLLAGLASLWAGAVLDVLLMPINKSLWSVSYCVFMNGWALVVFGAFYWLMDASGAATLRERARRRLLPFTIYGMNALFIFAFSGLVAKMLGFIKPGGTSLKGWLYAPIQSLPLAPVNASLLFAILFNAAMFFVAWFMWKRQWFVKV